MRVQPEQERPAIGRRATNDAGLPRQAQRKHVGSTTTTDDPAR
jgi:hypothetical protein